MTLYEVAAHIMGLVERGSNELHPLEWTLDSDAGGAWFECEHEDRTVLVRVAWLEAQPAAEEAEVAK